MAGFQSAIGGGTGVGKAPKPTPQTAPPQNSDQIDEQSQWWKFGTTTWFLITGLIIINAGMFVKPELLEGLGGRMGQFFDIRFWAWWYWPVFWIIIIGAATRYLLTVRIENMETQGEDSTQHVQLKRLVTITAIGLALLLVCVHADVFAAFRQFAGQLFSAGIPWWGMPLFWLLFIGVLITIWGIQRYREQSGQYVEWDRQTLTWTITGIGIGLAVIFAGIIGIYNGANFFTSIASMPWWGWSAVWIALIVGLLIYKVVMVVQEESVSNSPNTVKAMAVAPSPAPVQQKTKTFNAVTAPAVKKTFNAATGPRSVPQTGREKWSFSNLPGVSALADLGPIVWWSVAGVAVFIFLAWFGYWYTATEWIDKEGYPIAKPWWVWPLLFVLIGCGVVVAKVIIALREGAAEGAFRREKPKFTLPVKPQKPTGFNIQRKK